MRNPGLLPGENLGKAVEKILNMLEQTSAETRRETLGNITLEEIPALRKKFQEELMGLSLENV